MFRNKSVDSHSFAMVPRSDVPRSSFNAQKTYKTTFDSGYLIPVYVDEVLPGDTFNLKMTAFSRLTTPIFPIMDNLHMDSFFFFVPNRLVWSNWQRFMGERDPDPDSSIDYLIPQMVSPAGGYAANTLQDYMGLPTAGQIQPGNSYSHSAMFTRAYNLIWNEWFRDQNLQDSVKVDKGDGPDDPADYVLLKRGKRHDYFTSALPWPQKGESVGIPITSDATFSAQADDLMGTIQLTNTMPGNIVTWSGGAVGPGFRQATTGTSPSYTAIQTEVPVSGTVSGDLHLSELSAATINQLRQSFQIQKFIERDARGGTRYTEIIRSHFGVVSPDARLQRPEYLGGGTTPVNISPVAQTSETGQSPLGTLAAFGTTVLNHHGFSHSFTEHGMIIGLVMVRADLTYQQGLDRMWSRNTRYDYYFPVFSHLGEQAILNKEIYTQGTDDDDGVFGYQERWAEYRYKPSKITGQFRSTFLNPLDAWHLSQKFENLPVLNDEFISENPPLDRILAVGPAALGQQFYFDAFFNVNMVRPMPMYSVPGLIDHF